MLVLNRRKCTRGPVTGKIQSVVDNKLPRTELSAINIEFLKSLGLTIRPKND